MDVTFSLIGTDLDLTKVDGIPDARLVAFVNFWCSQSVRYLNCLAEKSESKIMQIENRLLHMNTKLTLIRAKLNSVAGLDSISQSETPCQPAPQMPVPAEVDIPSVGASHIIQSQIQETSSTAIDDVAATQNQSVATQNTVDIAYEKYFTMLKHGVPAPAVKQKMIMDGLDANILDMANVKFVRAQTKDESDSDESWGDDSSEISD